MTVCVLQLMIATRVCARDDGRLLGAACLAGMLQVTVCRCPKDCVDVDGDLYDLVLSTDLMLAVLCIGVWVCRDGYVWCVYDGAMMMVYNDLRCMTMTDDDDDQNGDPG